MRSSLRLRSQLLFAMLAVLATLGAATLLVVRHLVYSSVAQQVSEGSAASIQIFKNIQRERELQLTRSASMISELPILKALLTTHDPATIQDSSGSFWNLSGADLFILTGPHSEVLTAHARAAEIQRAAAAASYENVISSGRPTWFHDFGHLFWLFSSPVMTGGPEDERLVGYVIVGYDIDSEFARQLSQTVGSDIALSAGNDNDLLASTLQPHQQVALRQLLRAGKGPRLGLPTELNIDGDRYEVASVPVQGGRDAQVICYVLMPLQNAAAFLARINRYLLIVGVLGVLVAMLVVTVISSAITRPLDNLVAGVRALALGDFGYSISPKGSAEIKELGTAFSSMRLRLVEFQRQRIEAEQMAVLARTASSISHDLRHYLAAVVANAEFLYDAAPGNPDCDEIYSEIKAASDSMADLIESLRELTGEATSLAIAPAMLDQVVRRAVNAVRSRPEFRNLAIQMTFTGPMQGIFDGRKLERVLFNVVLNACEVVDRSSGSIDIAVSSLDDRFRLRISDNGSGIPEPIKHTLFDPFVSSDKPSGTGLGLAIAKKIICDHGGAIAVEASSASGSTILITLPATAEAARHQATLAPL
ncbi:MAG: ATP-binding protein [Acidobacteriaceae bacterium]